MEKIKSVDVLSVESLNSGIVSSIIFLIVVSLVVAIIVFLFRKKIISTRETISFTIGILIFGAMAIEIFLMPIYTEKKYLINVENKESILEYVRILSEDSETRLWVTPLKGTTYEAVKNILDFRAGVN